MFPSTILTNIFKLFELHCVDRFSISHEAYCECHKTHIMTFLVFIKVKCTPGQIIVESNIMNITGEIKNLP